MKYLQTSFILFFCIFLTLGAQTKGNLTQAKTDYKNKDYAKALPIFEEEYRIKPTDPSLNLWYGVCLIETGGSLDKAEECLLVAAKKNLPESYLYLGDMYSKVYRISEAIELYDRYSKAKPKERETVLKNRYEYAENLERLISRTEDVQIIDSLIVDKSHFLSAYKLSTDAGSISSFSSIFETNEKVESTVYTNGKGSKIYFGQPIERRYVLSTMDKLMNGFGNEKLISDNNFGMSGDTNYPYVLTDGTTIYFSAKDENGIGGYDIYVTRYNLNTNSYLAPEILNMPFNSTANDYLMVIDEAKGVGWFVTDRFQPENKVCVYTFIPNDEILLINTDDDRYKESRARILSIKDSWKKGKNYRDLIALARTDTPKTVEKMLDFTFIIDDTHTYHNFSDFRNSDARNIVFEVNNKRKELALTDKELEDKRQEYSESTESKKQKLSSLILSLERMQIKLFNDIREMEKLARNEEIKTLKLIK